MPASPDKPSLFTFGCMSLGSSLPDLDEHIRIARAAMDADIWFHASPTYHRGFTYMVLRMAFDEERSQVPPMIIKIRCGSAKLLRFEVEDVLRRLNIDQIAVAQLVFTESGPQPLVDDLTSGGPMAQAMAQFREQGKVARFCPQCAVGTSAALLPLAQDGHFDGMVLYLNPIQRDADDALWNWMREQGTSLWALRTLAGALGDAARYARRRADQPDDPKLSIAAKVIPLVDAAGCGDWTEFCLRYAASVPGLMTSIGGTADMAHLERYLSAANAAEPLPPKALEAIDAARRG